MRTIRFRNYSINVSERNRNVTMFESIPIRFAGKSAKSASAYLRVNEFCEKFIKWALYVTIGSMSMGMFCVAVAGVSFQFFSGGHVEPESIFMPWQIVYVN